MTKDHRRRIFLSNQDRSDRNVPLALAFAGQESVKDPTMRQICLLVATHRQLEGTKLGAVLGNSRCKQLRQGESVAFGSTSNLVLATLRSNRMLHQADAVIAVYADDALLREAESAPRSRLIIAASWVDEQCEQWRRAWNPEIPGQEAQPAQVLVSNPVVRAALNTLTGRINLGSGLLHPSDNHAAKEMLVILHDAGEWESPANMEAWALRRGWTPDGALALYTLAERVQSGSRFNLGRQSVWTANILSRWRERTTNVDSTTEA